jgi:hypothetical protein
MNIFNVLACLPELLELRKNFRAPDIWEGKTPGAWLGKRSRIHDLFKAIETGWLVC